MFTTDSRPNIKMDSICEPLIKKESTFKNITTSVAALIQFHHFCGDIRIKNSKLHHWFVQSKYGLAD